MWLHFLLFFLVVLIIAFQKLLFPNSKNNYIAFSGIFLLFFTFITFRAYTVGNDTPEYYRLFTDIIIQPSLFDALSISRYEIGYISFNYFIGILTNNFTVLLSIVAFFYLYTSCQFINKYAKSPLLAIILMFTFSLFYKAMIIQRQCIALSIIYLAISFLIKNKRNIFILLVCIASLFHSSALIILFVLFIPTINFSDIKSLKKWGIIFILSLLCLNIGIEKLLSFFPYYQHYYVSSIYSEGSIRTASIAFFGIRFFSLILVFITGGFWYQRKDNSNETLIFNKALVFDLFLAAASISFNLIDRFEIYFTLGFIIAIVNAVCSLKEYNRIQKNNKIIITLLLVLTTFAYMTATVILRSSWMGIFPYSFI